MKKNVKKILAIGVGLTMVSALTVGCDQQSDRVSYNISNRLIISML